MPRVGAARPACYGASMAGGLFELRKDAITGWWVAVVVDREFERQRFQVAAEPVAVPDAACQRVADEAVDEPAHVVGGKNPA